MSVIRLEHVRKVFRNGHVAVCDLSLETTENERIVIVGPSGSGKSTVLRLIAGLEPVTSGRIFIDGRDATHLPPQARDMAMVFQSYALYPHKNVRDNLAFGLQVRRVAAAEVEARVSKVASQLGLDLLLDRKPAQLSGGQRQRVALGRAIVRNPKAFLLDEPLSNLDPLLRSSTRSELAILHRQLATTMVYVTHDQEEAMTLGQRIVVMRDGAVEQLDAPRAVYDKPANTFVAQFVGSPAMNVWSGDDVHAVLAGAAIGRVVGVRPHDIELCEPERADIIGRIVLVEPLGSTTLIHVRADEPSPLLVRAIISVDARRVDERVGLCVRRDRLHLFDAITGRRVDE